MAKPISKWKGLFMQTLERSDILQCLPRRGPTGGPSLGVRTPPASRPASGE